jgi:hypothetical protein
MNIFQKTFNWFWVCQCGNFRASKYWQNQKKRIEIFLRAMPTGLQGFDLRFKLKEKSKIAHA